MQQLALQFSDPSGISYFKASGQDRLGISRQDRLLQGKIGYFEASRQDRLLQDRLQDRLQDWLHPETACDLKLFFKNDPDFTIYKDKITITLVSGVE